MKFAERVNLNDFNPEVELPYGITTNHIWNAMNNWTYHIDILNSHSVKNGLMKLEEVCPANLFSGLISEYMSLHIPKYCKSVVRNKYHHGHPDIIPEGTFFGDAVHHTHDGIEIKVSRYDSGWQGHNQETVWLMVFTFDANRQFDEEERPFRFNCVYAAKLDESEWAFHDRGEDSRRCPTSSVKKDGSKKMKSNWVYRRGMSHTKQVLEKYFENV